MRITKREKERIEEELQFLEQHLQAGIQVVPLSGTLTLEFGGTSENVYAGMDEEFRRYQPAILTWYETAQHAFDRGASWQNMGGLKIHSMVVSIISNLNLILSLKNLLGNSTSQPVHSIHL